MRKQFFSVLLCLLLGIGLLPPSAWAADPEEPPTRGLTIYVDGITGDDANGDGTQEHPFATLATAVAVAEDRTTIVVMSDLTMTKCARFYSKSLAITSDANGPYTVRRGDTFDQQQDPARSTYNPAMIEVQTNGDTPAGLTVTNLILDDGGKRMGTVFAQAVSGGDTSANTTFVQDAILASNATAPCTLTLGAGAVLRNFGGMSAVRITNCAKLVMEPGSVIEDEADVISGRGDSADATDPAKGPAGAVWLQGAAFEMEEGAVIQNLQGRAVYVDGGSAAIGGTIRNITGNSNLWQSTTKDGTQGIAVHVRNTEASATLAATAVIATIRGGGSAVYVTGSENRLTAEPQSVIQNLTKVQGVYLGFGAKAQLSGEITGVVGSNALSINDGAQAVLEAEGSIHDNVCETAVVYLRAGAGFTIRGKINDNASTAAENTLNKNCAAVFIVKNGDSSQATLEAGGEICNNINRGSKYGAAVEVQQGDCSFTMNGGRIAGNQGPLGAIHVHKGSARFVMNGGVVTENRAANPGGEAGILVESGTPVVELNAGTAQSMTLAKKVVTQTDKGNIYISDDFAWESGYVAMEQDNKTVAPGPTSRSIRLGNANAAWITALEAATAEKGWVPLATFWTQRNGGATLTVGGLSWTQGLPVYVLTLPVDETGNVVRGATVWIHAAQIEGDNILCKLPDVSGNGRAVAIVQPTEDYGTLTIDGTKAHTENDTGDDYLVTYTVSFEMSESLKNIIEQAEGVEAYALTLDTDDRLGGAPGTFDTHSVQVDYILPNEHFAAGDSLLASALLTIKLEDTTYVIPSNVAQTRMLPMELIKEVYKVVFDWNDGSGKTEQVFVVEDETCGDRMPADPEGAQGTFAGWNTQRDGQGAAFDKDTVITGALTVYAQWSKPSGGGSSAAAQYFFALEKVDAQDGHGLSGATFGLYLDGRQISTATSDQTGLAVFRIDESDYRKIRAQSDLYYRELTAPEGYDENPDTVPIGRHDLSDNRAKAEKAAGRVYNERRKTPAGLNSSDHVAYVFGYTDGTVRPNNPITRAETAAMLYRLLTDSRRAAIQTSVNRFSDVAPRDWYNEAVSTMSNGGYLVGYPDGTFGGNKNITRAEFVTMLVKFIGEKEAECRFSDVSRDHWAYGYIAAATQAGWLAGYADGTFQPAQAITRAEAMAILNRILQRGVDKNSELLHFKAWPDNLPTDWFYYEVIEATNGHEYTGSRPSENWIHIYTH